MNNKFQSWFSQIKEYKKEISISILFLIFALVLYALCGDYVTDREGSVVSPDLILDHVGPYNLAFIYVWFFIIVLALFFIYPLTSRPHEFHYVVNMFSLFVIVRSFFILFTHLSVPYDAIQVNFPGYLQVFAFSNDLFFSGHAGIPFLGFLIYKNCHKKLSYFMLTSSIILGITVLLMHVHYSIDVFSAFFITYGIYVIGNKFVKK